MNRPDDVTLVQRGMEFCLWRAMRSDDDVTPGEVMQVFGCSRATAFRRVRAYRDALMVTVVRQAAMTGEAQICAARNA